MKEVEKVGGEGMINTKSREYRWEEGRGFESVSGIYRIGEGKREGGRRQTISSGREKNAQRRRCCQWRTSILSKKGEGGRGDGGTDLKRKAAGKGGRNNYGALGGAWRHLA